MCFLLCYICIVLGERTKKKMMLETLDVDIKQNRHWKMLQPPAHKGSNFLLCNECVHRLWGKCCRWIWECFKKTTTNRFPAISPLPLHFSTSFHFQPLWCPSLYSAEIAPLSWVLIFTLRFIVVLLTSQLKMWPYKSSWACMLYDRLILLCLFATWPPPSLGF